MARGLYSRFVGNINKRGNVPRKNLQVSIYIKPNWIKHYKWVLQGFTIYCLLQSFIFNRLSGVYFIIPGKWIQNESLMFHLAKGRLQVKGRLRWVWFLLTFEYSVSVVSIRSTETRQLHHCCTIQRQSHTARDDHWYYSNEDASLHVWLGHSGFTLRWISYVYAGKGCRRWWSRSDYFLCCVLCDSSLVGLSTTASGVVCLVLYVAFGMWFTLIVTGRKDGDKNEP